MKAPVNSDGGIPRAGVCECTEYRGVKKGRCRVCNLTRYILCPICKQYSTRALGYNGSTWSCLGCSNNARAPMKGRTCTTCSKPLSGLNPIELCFACSKGERRYSRCQFCDTSMFSDELKGELERCPSCNARPLPSTGKLDSCSPAAGGGKNRPPSIPMAKDDIRHEYEGIQGTLASIEKRCANLEELAVRLGKEASLLGVVHNPVRCRAIFAHRKMALKSVKLIRKPIPELRKDLERLRQRWREIKATQTYPVEVNGHKPKRR